MERLELRQLLAADLSSDGIVADSVVDAALIESASQSVLPVTLSSDTAGQPSEQWKATQLFIVDSGIAGYEELVAGIHRSLSGQGNLIAEVIVLDANRDGVQQLSEQLKGREGLQAIHILSHGSSGSLRLGKTQLNSATLEGRQHEVSQWNQSLAVGGDILLYGCNVADGSIGVSFIERFAAISGADIAASTDLTGAADLGGDWRLEYATGIIDIAPLSGEDSRASFAGVLADVELNGQDGAADYFRISETSIQDKHCLLYTSDAADDLYTV